MKLVIYPLLHRKSQLAMKRVKTYGGKRYSYSPRAQLLRRLSKELGMSLEAVREQIERERAFLIQYPGYFLK